VERGRTFTPPPHGFSVRSCTEEQGRHLVFGVTTVEMQCSECGDVKETLLTGDRRPKGMPG
jgi:hypothetical protein